MHADIAAITAAGHNRGDVTVRVEARAFNSLHDYIDGGRVQLDVPAGSTVGDVARRLRIPAERIWLVLVNGRDITGGLVGAPVRDTRELEDGDVVAFSGPVPYSYGLGAPVV